MLHSITNNTGSTYGESTGADKLDKDKKSIPFSLIISITSPSSHDNIEYNILVHQNIISSPDVKTQSTSLVL